MRAGFSLVEVLVAVLIFAMTGAVGLALLTAALDSRDMLTSRQDDITRLDTARMLLRDDLGQLAMRPTRGDDGQASSTVLAGSADGVSLWGAPADGEVTVLALTRRGWANPGGQRPRGSLQRVEYVLTVEGLVRRVTPYPDSRAETPVTDRLIVPGAGAVSVEFLHGRQWLSRGAVSLASGASPAPQAVRLRYDLPRLGEVEHVVLIGGAP